MKEIIIKLIVFLCLCIPIFQNGIYQNEELELISIIIATICSITLFLFNKEPYSLYKMFIIFVSFFFCAAPIIQYKENVQFFGTIFSDKDYIITSVYVLFILLSVTYLYIIFRRGFARNIRNRCEHVKLENVTAIKANKELLLILISASVCCYYLYINNFNIISLMFRGGEFTDRVNQGQIASMVAGNFFRPMPMIIFLGAYIMKVKHKVVLPILFILMIISSPPTGMARFSAAAIYIPVILCTLSIFKKRYVFIMSMVLGLLVVFPFLNNFRNMSEGKQVSLGVNFDQFLELHFDSYSMFMRVLSEDIVTNGRQLLGPLFFFVPRSMWPDKPTGSGHYLMESMGADFTNVSMPYFGEGYINFGILGVILFVVFLAYIMARFDSRYWSVNEHVGLDQIKYCIMLALLMFILRGDLMSSCAFTCGMMCSFYAVKRLLTSK